MGYIPSFKQYLKRLIKEPSVAPATDETVEYVSGTEELTTRIRAIENGTPLEVIEYQNLQSIKVDDTRSKDFPNGVILKNNFDETINLTLSDFALKNGTLATLSTNTITGASAGVTEMSYTTPRGTVAKIGLEVGEKKQYYNEDFDYVPTQEQHDSISHKPYRLYLKYTRISDGMKFLYVVSSDEPMYFYGDYIEYTESISRITYFGTGVFSVTDGYTVEPEFNAELYSEYVAEGYPPAEQPVLGPASTLTFGDGTTIDAPKKISTPQELQDMSLDVSLHYGLANDIDMTGFTWTPIGGSGTEFTGSFNGDVFKISNLNINTAQVGSGLFGRATTGATFKNIMIENPTIVNNGTNTGALVGFCAGPITVDNVKVTNAYVEATSYFGLIIGGLDGTLTKSYAKGSINKLGTNYTQYTGGLVGAFKNTASISKCWVDATLNLGTTSDTYNGGIFGTTFGTGTKTVSDVYCLSHIINGNNNGSFAGKAESVTFENCLSWGILESQGTGSRSGVAYNTGNTFTSTFFNIDIAIATTANGFTGKRDYELADQATYTGWDFTNVWEMSTIGTETRATLIENPEI